MSPDQSAPHDPLVRLPAERRQFKNEGITLYAGCCCCCCCCLHTIGGVIGAAYAGSFRAKPTREIEDDDEFDYVPIDPADRPRPLVGSQRLFWISLLVVVLLQVVVAGIAQPRDLTDLLLVSGAGLIMLGPLYLFAASVVMVIWIGLSPSLRRHPGYFQSALRIFGAAFLGTAVGMGAMIGIVVLISLGK